MPALMRRAARMRQNSEGRRRTSLEGGNRGYALRRVRIGDGLWGFEWWLSALDLAHQADLPGDDIAQMVRLEVRCA